MRVLCGCRPLVLDAPYHIVQPYEYLPRVSLSSHTTVLSTTSRTVLTQQFINDSSEAIPECQYDFPLYDGVSVVGFTCQIGSRTIKGVVKEKNIAKKVYEDALNKGETAGLLAQGPSADIFSTKIGNVPAMEEIHINITYIGELKHDVGAESIRFTIPTNIAPRYSGGTPPSKVRRTSAVSGPSAATARGDNISITVDIHMAEGSFIREVRSPSHPLAVTLGNTTGGGTSVEPKPSQASASLSQGNSQLDKDFVLEILSNDSTTPKAVLEAHHDNTQDRALMVTLVPSFKLPSAKPEIILVADRSGSMERKIPALINALKIFLRSLPVGVHFNMCSFGSSHTFLWENSHVYDEQSLNQAIQHVETFSANYGGTETLAAIKASIETRDVQQDLALILCTDGDIRRQEDVFLYLNQQLQESKKAIRVFPLGIGDTVSSGLIEGVARAGKGFASTVGEHEKMDAKVVRILKAALVENVTDYTLEVQFEREAVDDDGFVLVERVVDSLEVLSLDEVEPAQDERRSSKQADRTSPDQSFDRQTRYEDLPEVATPVLLQTPQEIPPLYTSARATVYLLMSPEASHRKPKSVVLRGTSTQGPLEYNIPVEILTEPDETIHQLAARKAVGELEEGRGWLFLARDQDGTLLKHKYANMLTLANTGKETETKEPRFQMMVEREAVRLGVQYQVGGKWCSFVAVEGDQETTQEGNTRISPSDGYNYRKLSRQLMPAQQSASNMGWRPMSAGGSIPLTASRTACSARDSVMSESTPSYGAYRHAITSTSTTESMTPLSASASYDAFGAAPTAYAAQFSPSIEAYPPLPARRRAAASTASTAHVTSSAKRNKSNADDMHAPSQIRGRQADPVPPSAYLSPQSSPLDQIIALQSFQGYWIIDQALLDVCSLTQNSKANAILSQSSQEQSLKRIWGTVLAVMYLERKMAAQKDAWELVVDKAMDYLQQSGVDMQEEMGKSPLKELLTEL